MRVSSIHRVFGGIGRRTAVRRRPVFFALVEGAVARLRELGATTVRERVVIDEDVTFPLPRELVEAGR